ncbi:MAG: hypothetical protein MRERV_15c014 [Mycoplasmataceae bacterium RV_VA103A]|nr:MAG: hypothetical protein MRERV_15c014 [Mycoplasmataceae bacterium RV_VA103A]
MNFYILTIPSSDQNLFIIFFIIYLETQPLVLILQKK